MKGFSPMWPAAVLLVALGSCGRSQANTPKAAPSEPPPLPGDVQKLAPSPSSEPGATPEAANSLSATGEFVSAVRSQLVSKQPGRVARVLVDQGAHVRKGQPLLELETDYPRLEARRAEAEVQRARAAAADATRDFDRKKDLSAKGSVAPAVYDRSRSAEEQAQAALQAAEAALALARQRLQDAALRSPIDGVVMERRVNVGERLGDDTVAFVIVQNAPLKLRFRVPERYLDAVRAGQSVIARVDPYPDEDFAGRVAVVVDAVDQTSRTFGVEAEFANHDGRLRPGLFARVELALAPQAAGPRGGARAQAR